MPRLQLRASFPVSSEVTQPKRHLPPKYVPNELIGAFNVLTACVRLPIASIRRARVVHAQSSSALPALQRSRRFEADLDFKPKLSKVAWITCVIFPPLFFWIVACALQGTLKPDTAPQRLFKTLFHLAWDSWLSWTWALMKFISLFLCSAASSALLRYQLRERQFARHQHSREQLADADSLFKDSHGVSVHYKQAAPKQSQQQQEGNASTDDRGLFRIFFRRKPTSRQDDCEPVAEGQTAAAATMAIALYHGFGANLWSWMKVQQELADATCATVVAHDMPGFGLTERAATQSAYTLQTNGDIGRQLAAEALSADMSSCSVGSSDRPRMPSAVDSRSSEKYSSNGSQERLQQPVVLVGHSLGAAGIASSFVHNQEGVAAIVLVAPAILVSPFSVSPKLRSRKIISDDSSHRLLEEYGLQAGDCDSEEAGGLPADEQARQARSAAAAALHRVKAFLVPLLFWLIRPAVFVVLRALVRVKSFWERGLKSCYFDTAKLSSDIVYYYRLPQLMKGWEMGILRFLQARFMANEYWQTDDAIDTSLKTESGANEYVTKGNSLLSRFERCVKDTQVPVLIIHGEQDTLVPIGNSCRLSAVIQAPLVKISGCGHTPAEELPETFIAEVARFLKDNVWSDMSAAREGTERSKVGTDRS